MDDWVDEKESVVSVSKEEKIENPSNGDEQAGLSTSIILISTREVEKEKILAEGNGEISGTGTGIIESIASMIPGHSTDEGGGEHKEEENGEAVASMTNKERQDQIVETSAGTGIIDSIASKFGVTVSGHSTKVEEQQQEEDQHKDKDNGDQPISSPPDSLPVSDEDVPAADEAILLISIIED